MNSDRKHVQGSMRLLVIATAALTLMVGCGESRPNFQPGDTATIGDGTQIGCIERSDKDEIVRLVLQVDKKAANAVAMRLVYAERCSLFKQGEKVVVVQRRVEKSAEVHRPDSPITFWVKDEALQ